MAKYSFNEKVCVITGAGSGIGQALAENLAKRGAKLALSDIDLDGLSETKRRCTSHGALVRSDYLDVSDREAVMRYPEAVLAQFGQVNQVYNNAGITHFGSVQQSSYHDIERVMNVDYWGVVHGTKAFLPHLINSGDGHVVNISSLAGLMAAPSQSAYTAAKFAVRGFTEALRQEMLVGHRAVRVTCVHPGGVKTAVARNSTVADGLDQVALAHTFDTKWAIHSSEMAAEAIIRGVARGRARVLVGYETKMLDLLVRIGGPAYQQLAALGSRLAVPEGQRSSRGL